MQPLYLRAISPFDKCNFKDRKPRRKRLRRPGPGWRRVPAATAVRVSLSRETSAKVHFAIFERIYAATRHVHKHVHVHACAHACA